MRGLVTLTFLFLCCLLSVPKIGYSTGNIQDSLPDVDFTNYDLTEIRLSANGVQPESIATVTLDVEDDDGTVNNYVYHVAVQSDGTFAIPVVSAERARSVIGRVDYLVMLRETQLTPAANMARNASILPRVSCGRSCTENHPLADENRDLAADIRPYYCTSGRCPRRRYDSEFFDIYPVVNQSFAFEWDRDAGGVTMSGRGTPRSHILLSSSTDLGFNTSVAEYDSNDEAAVDLFFGRIPIDPVAEAALRAAAAAGSIETISTLWPLWTTHVTFDREPVSSGIYEVPFMAHSEAGAGSTQFNAVLMNTHLDYARRGIFMPIEGNATSFNVDIETGIEQVPDTPDDDDGYPDEATEDAFNSNIAVAAVAGVVGYLSSAFSTDNTYGEGLWTKWVEQITSTDPQLEKQNQEILDAKLAGDGVKHIEKVKAKAIINATPSEGLCEVVSLSKKSRIPTTFRQRENRQFLREGMMKSVYASRGTLSSLSPRERTQWRRQQILQTYCHPSAKQTAAASVCPQPFAHIDPNCLFGGETKDADPYGEGTVDDACGFFLSNISPARRPFVLPSPEIIEEKGSLEVNQVVAEYAALPIQAAWIADSFSDMHASTLKGDDSSAAQFRGLMEELNFSDEEIEKVLPAPGVGLSEVEQLEMVSKYLIANPDFFLKLQSNDVDIARIRMLIRSLSLSLDHQITEMMAHKARQMAGINALLLRDDRERANTALMRANAK